MKHYLLLGLLLPVVSLADDSEKIAKKLANPIADLLNIPFQFNFDNNASRYTDEFGNQTSGRRFQLNIQPVVPIVLNNDWNIISQSNIPIIDQHDIRPQSGTQSGLGDISQNLFLSPSMATESGVIWGIGSAFQLPTGTDALTSSRKWSMGPGAVVAQEKGHWFYGLLVNHVWSFAGSSRGKDVSATYLQPFVSYITSNAWTFTLVSEASYDWTNRSWTAPVDLVGVKVLEFGSKKISVGGGIRYWAASPESGPADWGGRVTVTWIYSK